MSKIDLRDIPQNIIDSVEVVYVDEEGVVTISKLKNSVIVTLPMSLYSQRHESDKGGFFYHLASVISLSDDFIVGETIIATMSFGKYDILALESCLRMGYKAEELSDNSLLSDKVAQDGFKQILWKN